MLKSRSKESIAILGILLILLMVGFYDVFFLNKTFKATTANAQALHTGVYGQEENKPSFIPVNGSDSPVLEEPIYEFIKRNLRKGILPLWNPHQACGYPLIGLIQVGMFYPLHFILYLLPEFFAWDVMIITRFLLSGLFTFWLMKIFGFKKIPSLAAAITFMLSGPMVLLQYWTANVDILAPLLIVCIERILRKPDKLNSCLLAIIISLTFFGGHPEHIFLVNAYGIAFLIYRASVLRKSISFKKVIGPLIFSYILGIGLAAMVLVPFLYNLATEFWKGHPPRVGLLNEEFRERILSLAVPHFFQKVPLTYTFIFAGWWGGYLGTLPLALGFISLFNNHKRGLNYFFAIMGFLIVSKAYGFFYINWIGYLPLFNMCRYAIHTPHLVALSFAVLAGMGVRTLLSGRKLFLKGLAFSIILLIIIGFHLLIHRTATYFDLSIKATLYALGILILFQIILFLRDKNIFKAKYLALGIVALLSIELMSYIHRERPYRYNSFGTVPYIEYLKSQPQRDRAYGVFWAFYPNTATGFEVDDLGIFFGLLPKRFVHFIHNLVNQNIFAQDLRPPALRALPLTYGTPFLDLLNVKYLITPPPSLLSKIIINFDEVNANRKPPVYSDEVNIYVRSDAFPRAYIVHKALFQTDRQATFDFLRKMQLKMHEFIMLNAQSSPHIRETMAKAPVLDKSSAKISHYSANKVIVQADLENPGFLVLSDAYHPDWKVYVDGRPERLYEANNFIRSVFLTEGKHEVKFVFRPLSFYGGVLISGFCLCLVIVMLASHRARKYS